MATTAKHTENNGKDIIAQSHHATVVRTQEIPLYTMRNNNVYGEQHIPVVQSKPGWHTKQNFNIFYMIAWKS